MLKIIALCVLALTATMIYHPIVNLGFAQIDDGWMLLDYKLVHPQSFNLQYLYKVFTDYNSLQYAPVNTLFYYLIYQINGYDAYWYHLACFFIHVINTLLVYGVCKHILGVFKVNSTEWIAFIICFIWMVHPFQVESVVWISGSKIVLCSMFGLLSIWCYFIFFQTKKLAYYIISLFLFILSCFSKEQAVVFPLVLICFVFFNKNQTTLKRSLYTLIPFFILSLIVGLITVDALKSAIGQQTALSDYPFGQRLVLSFYCLCFYIYNFFVPLSLHYHYPFPMLAGQPLPTLYYVFPIAIILMLFYFIGFLKKQVKAPLYLFALLFFFIHIALCIQIIPLHRPAMMADRYMYMPSIGFLLIAIPLIYETIIQSSKKSYLTAAVVLLVLIVLCQSIYSYQLVTSWSQFNIA